ncbi:MAG: GGDEF domain-containing protein, partial [Myxococcota bacterium]
KHARLLKTVVEEAASPPSAIVSMVRDRGLLTVLAGERAGALFELVGNDDFIIGRGDEADIRLGDDGLSRAHARIYRRGPLYLLEDLHSTNGTFLGRERLHRPHPLDDEARIGLGRATILKFSLKDALEASLLLRQYESTVRDPLTGAYNRRALEERLRSEFAFARRHETPLGVFMFDIDHFKRVNDTYGHPVGDAVLREVSRRIRSAIRTEDFFARLGGEEFCLVVRGVETTPAAAVGERLRRLIAREPVGCGGVSVAVTVSIGFHGLDDGGPVVADAAALLAGADAALYRAKRGGRNRLVVARYVMGGGAAPLRGR